MKISYSTMAGFITAAIMSITLPIFSITETSILYWIIAVLSGAFAGWIVK